ncbi:3'-5' exonuclease [Parabacteroides chinchillae]|uniref:DNA polymerase-3 subunit epsilon n=1 Tax=Parabacteroides chinchillae TaxID=871327 RepID=A0A8G2BXZ2_9BACT|nr:3'-5' exonuclease [Parabacteroides chinchillae]SEG11672.1 DNA polymerase-3 subunit epsilon [Parabacteroides chinchillae]
MERFAAIDFETANGKRSSVCSVGIAIVEGDTVVDSIYTLIRPVPNYYSPWTTAIHGITAEDTNDAPDFEEVWARIAPRIQDIPLVAHNSPFDEGCLKAVHQVYGLAYPHYDFYCTCRLSRKLYPYLCNHQLQTVAAHCGYDLTYHHHAMADAYACAHIANTMMRERGVESLQELVRIIY